MIAVLEGRVGVTYRKAHDTIVNCPASANEGSAACKAAIGINSDFRRPDNDLIVLSRRLCIRRHSPISGSRFPVFIPHYAVLYSRILTSSFPHN